MHKKKKRVFVLTDGQVHNRAEVAAQARSKNDETRVYTFGLGSGCDVLLCEEVAVAGRGTCSIVKDGGKDLNGLVIKALQSATEPSLKNCSVSWSASEKPGEGQLQLNEVFRNQSIVATTIVPLSKFSQLAFSFKSEEDPLTKQPIQLSFASTDFEEVKDADAAANLFKFAAFKQIQNTRDVPDQIKLSKKY